RLPIGVQGNGNQNQIGNEEYDLMAAATDLDEIKEVNTNCILMANLQQASTSGTQTDSAPVYDTDGSAEVLENCDDNEIFNMFTQEEQYTKLLEPNPESHQVPQNNNDYISEDASVEQGGEIVEQHSVNYEETCALYDSLYQNLAIEVEKVNSVNCKLKETNADMTTELARFKNQKRCFEISQEKYDKHERCYQQSVYQEQCLSKRINALYLSFGKQIMTLNEQISELNKQLSKEKSTVSFLLEEKKRLKSDFKTCEDRLLDKQPNSFYHTEQKMALGYQNPFYLKQAQKKQQSLYDGKVLLEKRDPPIVHDSEETLQLTQENDLVTRRVISFEGNDDDDDDVFTEVTPLASKIPTVDYQIHPENNKPYYKIIKADGTHKLFLSFITLLKNIDKEDLNMLWKLVQERFQY
nr:hypothetical protein [Tanacetum cinerariifolium]